MVSHYKGTIPAVEILMGLLGVFPYVCRDAALVQTLTNGDNF